VGKPGAQAEANLAGTEPGAFLAIGRIVKTQGRRGEVLTEILTDFPEHFEGLKEVFLGSENQCGEAFHIENTWPHKGRIVLKFSNVDSISQAERLVGLYVLVPREERTPLPADHYYVWELRGCRVVQETEGGLREVGTVVDVDPTGGVDLLRVARPDSRRGEVLIPLAQTICKRIDTEAKIIVIDPPEDLLDLNP
jgi:16S rRNA processing protein RimM